MQGILPQFYKFKVTEESKFGRGIVALSEIEEGEIICKVTGPIMTLKQFFEKYETNGCNVLQIGEDEYIDTNEPYLFFNHSCNPNAGVRNKGIIFALKKINKNEEITFDYSTTCDDVIWSMPCSCGEKDCRKIIGDFQTIPHLRKQYYLEKNALISHIKSLYY